MRILRSSRSISASTLLDSYFSPQGRPLDAYWCHFPVAARRCSLASWSAGITSPASSWIRSTWRQQNAGCLPPTLLPTLPDRGHSAL